VRNINQLLNELIPPSDYQHRNGFSNENIVHSLTDEEKPEVEQNLIQMLDKKDDELIGETLAIMKSTKSLPILQKRLECARNPTSKIFWASYINEINGGSEEMKLIALNETDNVTEKYSQIGIFHQLAKFNDTRINEKIRNFINHKDYLIAYNARVSLGIDTAELVNNERIRNETENKKWWEIWKN